MSGGDADPAGGATHRTAIGRPEEGAAKGDLLRRCASPSRERLHPLAYRFQNERSKSGSFVRLDVRHQLSAHPRLPVALQVLRDTFTGLAVVGHGLEEFADAVGHVNEVVNVHGRQRMNGHRA